MVKQTKKKGGKKDAPKEESSQSTVSLEEASTSAPQVAAEQEEDAGLTGGARKKKEKKEKKEKALQALQALQASRKPAATPSEATSETASRADSEIPSEPPSRAQSEAPSEVSSAGTVKTESKVPTKMLEELSLKEKTEPKTEETEEVGLGLTGGTKKKKPRKKKAETTQPPEDQHAPAIKPVQARPIPTESLPSPGAPGAPGAVPVVAQVPEPVQGPPPGPWGRGASQSAGRGRGEALRPAGAATMPPPGMPISPQPSPAYPQQAPPQFSGQARPQFPGQVPPQFPGQVPPQFPGQGPPQFPGQGPPQFPGQAPPQFPGQGPPQFPGQGPPQLPGQAPPQFPGQAPPQFPRQATPQFPGQTTPQFSPQLPPQASQQKIQTVRPPGPSPKSLEPVMCRYKIPTKIPGCTVRVMNIKLLVNYLEMEFKSLQIPRYDVSFHPDRPKKMLPNVFQQVKAKYFANDLLAFDQMKNCYSLRPLKNVTSSERFTTSVSIVDQNGKTMNFEVSMKATGVVDLANIKRYMTSRGSSLCHPTEEIQCIDVILRQGALESYVKAGRQFFKRPAKPVDLGYGYEMWTGLFQSAIFTNKAFINIDVAHKGFPRSQSLLDALIKDFNLDPSQPVENQRGGDYFAAFVKGLKVVALLVGDTPSAGHRREFVCNGLVGPPAELVFTLNEPNGGSRKTTVAEYFAKDKKYRLKYPKLNCLWVGSRDKCIYFPIELLHVAYGQPLSRQLNEVQVSKMVREAATPPDDRMQKIKEVISNMKYSQNKDFKQFGLEISEKFYSVKAKILEPPTLEIGNNAKIQPRRGQWQANRLLKPEPLQSWGLIALDTDPRNDYDPMISMIMSTGTQMGMSIAKPKIVNVNAKMRSLHSILSNAYQDVRFVFIIVSARGRDDYHKVKQMAEREVGILTQCIKEMTARRMNPMTAKNILLKVNSKLMGINQAIDSTTMPKCLREGGVMIVGADVTHPSPDQSNVPSIAAVTASLDPKCYIYNIELSIQTPKKEVIVEFEDMMFDHLKLYKERNNSLPKKIFVFRDGVSEGQFAQVMNSELLAVHNAYHRMVGPSRKPEVLFLLVQKRHHTRLFNEGRNSQYNVEPGTVVDTDIVHSSELDFYLVSHQAIKGTARPTRYHAVCNDGKIPDDEVEQLTYYLCHLYSRCMRSVSYPTPTYYAHLACLRARSLTHGEKFDNKELERKPKRLHVLDKMLQFSRMFFV